MEAFVAHFWLGLTLQVAHTMPYLDYPRYYAVPHCLLQRFALLASSSFQPLMRPGAHSIDPISHKRGSSFCLPCRYL